MIFDSFLIANEFVTNSIRIISTNWLAYIPDDGLYNIGLVYDIPAEISLEKLTWGFSLPANSHFDRIERIFKWIDSDQGKV